MRAADDAISHHRRSHAVLFADRRRHTDVLGVRLPSLEGSSFLVLARVTSTATLLANVVRRRRSHLNRPQMESFLTDTDQLEYTTETTRYAWRFGHPSTYCGFSLEINDLHGNDLNFSTSSLTSD
jgi:hypothetical protein